MSFNEDTAIKDKLGKLLSDRKQLGLGDTFGNSRFDRRSCLGNKPNELCKLYENIFYVRKDNLMDPKEKCVSNASLRELS